MSARESCVVGFECLSSNSWKAIVDVVIPMSYVSDAGFLCLSQMSPT